MLYSAKLRELANYLESHPVVDESTSDPSEFPSIWIIADGWDHFQAICRDMGGFTKSGYNGTLDATHSQKNDITKEYEFMVNVSVTGQCEATQKIDEDGTPITRTLPASPERVVPVMTYKCPESWTS